MSTVFRLGSVALGIVCGPILCCWITLASCCCPGRLHRSRESEDKKRFERRQVLAPRPLPVRPLENSLTIPVPSAQGNTLAPAAERRGKTIDQPHSCLLQLPLELRQMIYRAVLGDNTFHMILKKRKLGHLRCKAPSTVDCPLGFNGMSLSRKCCWNNTDSANIWWPTKGDGDGPTGGDVLPLLQTCRQVYSEAIDLVYSTNCFSFSDLDCLRYFSSTTLPHRFARVQSLDIGWSLTWPIYEHATQALFFSSPSLYPPHDEATWEETWRIISDMPNLKFIRASLIYMDWIRDNECEARILAPLRKVTRPKKFEVHVGWNGEEIHDAPFQLIRPMRHDPSSSDESSDE